MPYPQFDRLRVQFQPLSSRKNKLVIAKDTSPRGARAAAEWHRAGVIAEAAARIRAALRGQSPGDHGLARTPSRTASARCSSP